MAQAMGRWGPDGTSVLTDGSAVLGFAGLAVTPESLHERMPLRDESRGILFAAAARLDNRDELCDCFGIPLPERETVPDGRLVLEAWRAWGEACPTRLFGDWSLAVWDKKRRCLFLARDQLGQTGLYYYHSSSLLAFASDPEGLFALKGIERSIEERYLASYLTVFPLTAAEETCWRNVRQLLSGSCMVVSPDGSRTRRYWEMKPRSVLDARPDDYVGGFLERYRAAVKARLRSRRPVGSTLSCGLDSGSVTALAARMLKEQGQGLTAFTSVPLYRADHLVSGARADEWPLARTVSQWYDNIEHHAVDASSISPLRGIERAVSITRQPQHAASNEYWLMAIQAAARERGIGVMLTGQLGNGGVSWSGGRDRILYLFLRGKWDEGMKAMARWKRRNGCSWIRAITGQVVKPLLRPYYKRSRQFLSAPRWGDYSAIHPDFASRIGLLEAMKAEGHDPAFSRTVEPFEERYLTLVRNGIMAGPLWHVMGTAFGMEVRDPTADIALLEYCLNVPEEQYTFDGGRRMLIRRAMEGVLPPEIQWNTVRGRQGADVSYRILHHREEMDAALDRLAANPLVTSYLDVVLMRSIFDELKEEVTPQRAVRAAGTLLRGVMCGCFLEDASGSRSA